jgi:hypothetical protein
MNKRLPTVPACNHAAESRNGFYKNSQPAGGFDLPAALIPKG